MYLWRGTENCTALGGRTLCYISVLSVCWIIQHYLPYTKIMCLNLSKRVIKFLISNWYSLFGFVRSKYSTKSNGGWEGQGIQLYTCIHLVNKLTIYNAKCKFYIVNIIVHFVNANFGRINFKTIDNIKRPTQRVTAYFFH